jgi:hypothetical protein
VFFYLVLFLFYFIFPLPVLFLSLPVILYKEIIVFKDFEVENGVLGLERDIYLSIVKFLDSSILRKV